MIRSPRQFNFECDNQNKRTTNEFQTKNKKQNIENIMLNLTNCKCRIETFDGITPENMVLNTNTHTKSILQTQVSDGDILPMDYTD